MVSVVRRFLLIFCTFIFVNASDLQAQNRLISPFQYGYDKAKTGEERYDVLYKTHCEAIRLGANVDYTGLKEITLNIPANAQSIPLTDINDFAGVIFIVENKSRDFFLFQKKYSLEPLEVTKTMIKKGFYPNIRKKTPGRVLLIIEDKTPWVEKRNGYNYGVNRKDLLIVKSGKAVNSPIFPYNSEQTKPVAYYRELNSNGTVVKNLIFNRESTSTHITYLLNICNEDNIRIENIETNTPENTLKGDAVFRIENSANICFTNVIINNTYSSNSSYGYGVNLENVYNVTFDTFSGFAGWGIFGNNNVNTAYFKSCKLNRFDVHCYGRDVSFENCEFFDLYNQFSSFFGKLVFKSCIFTKFIPVAVEMSYNAYTGFDVFFENCTLNTTSAKHVLVAAGRIDEMGCDRDELSALCWPNVYVNDLTVNAGEDANPLYIFNAVGDNQNRTIEYLSNVKINGLVYNKKGISQSKIISLCDREVLSSNALEIILKNIKLEGESIDSEMSKINDKYIPIKQKNGKKHKVIVKNCSLISQ